MSKPDDNYERWDYVDDEKIRKILHILDTGVEGLCDPEFTQLTTHLVNIYGRDIDQKATIQGKQILIDMLEEDLMMANLMISEYENKLEELGEIDEKSKKWLRGQVEKSVRVGK